MTTTATAPACPKCAGPVWDQLGSKFWGNGLFKSGKQKPRWECKNKECGGAIWDKGNGAIPPTATPPKSAPAKQAISHSNVPNEQLPEFLRDAESEDRAELQGKLGFDIRQIETTLSLYQGVYEWYLRTIVPIATKADIGASPESVNAGVATIMIQAKGK